MNARSYFVTDVQGAIEPIEELARVFILHDIVAEDGILPRGSKGTVLEVYENGIAYCVEFTEPFEALRTIPCEDLRAV